MSANTSGSNAAKPDRSIELLGKLMETLKGYTKKEAKKAIALLANSEGLRTIPIGMSVTPVNASAPAKAGSAKENTPKQTPAPPAAYKQTAEWKAAEAERGVAVAALKSAGEADKPTREAALREIESRMKAIKAANRA